MTTPAFPSATPRPCGAGAPPCCGGPPVADASACCARDEAQKAAGKPGCGCGAVAAPASGAETAEAEGSGGCCGAKAEQPAALSHC